MFKCRAGWSSNILCSVGHQPPVRGRDLFHRDREGDGECGESHAVHQGSSQRERQSNCRGKVILSHSPLLHVDAYMCIIVSEYDNIILTP